MWRKGATSPARGRFLLVLSTTSSQHINYGFIAPTSVLRDKHVTEEEEEEQEVASGVPRVLHTVLLLKVP